ncbi:MAG: glycerate kinase [Roseateles asaccharophilus]|uniref:glycerate kinase type-2 family protein n=1 Tax=Roseateles asaccharophilus TaxID=582607 RepID=UPI001061FACE|nr:glycerate kinase [Roseateles asaccharophilus]MDN3545682.1 glycerate kinase [Roseateles asaccharophilus]
MSTASSWRADPRALLRHLFEVAVAQALPLNILAAQLPDPPRRGRTLVLGAGKAAGAMAQALEAAWPEQAPLSGLLVTRYGHVPPGYRPRRLRVVEAAHPVPDAAGQQAAQDMLALCQGLGPDDLVLCLISGGGSSLLSLPAAGLSLQHKQDINRELLRSGASIEEMNCVRKHLSAIKGGRLALACGPARVLTLAISDVPGDDPAVIASGPTLADPSSCADALAICRRYGLNLPPVAQAGLESGAFETPKSGDPRLAGHEFRMLATPQQSLEAAARAARELGLEAHILSDAIEGESREVGRVHAALARAVARRDAPFRKPCVLLSGGETTVTLRTRGGRGGRATEFLLGAAIALQREPGVYGLAADTDGIDGVEDNAGALLTPDTLARAAALGLSAQRELEAHNAYGFFAPLGDLVSPGPTFTNVNDFRAFLIV